MMEFHIARNARERYQFSETLFSYAGNVVFANMAACRQFAHRMNLVRDAKNHPQLAVHAGQLFAMGLIDEASHVLMARYRQDFDPEVMTSALAWFGAQVGADELDKLLLTFVEHFPGSSVMRGELTPQQWLAGATEGTPHRAAALEEPQETERGDQRDHQDQIERLLDRTDERGRRAMRPAVLDQ